MSIEYSNLTDQTFPFFPWSNQLAIAVKTRREVTPRHLLPCQNTLKFLKFENETSTNSIKSFLRTCPHIVDLEFTDVLLDEYCRHPQDKVIEHPSIASITIKTCTKIGKKEHWLIDFFVWRVKFRNLTSIRVQKIYSTQLAPVVETNEFMESFGPVVDSDIFSQLIQKNWSTLKELELGGCGLKMRDLVGLRERRFDVADKIALDSFKFSFDADALNVFLKSQSSLKELKTSHIFQHDGRHINVPEIIDNIFECVLLNSQTLTHICIYPVMIIDQSRAELIQNYGILRTFTIDCALFQNCPNLQSLRLGLHVFRNQRDLLASEKATIMGARLTNLHLIPTQLSQLYIPVEEYSRDELEIFGARLATFGNLTSFYFGTSHLNEGNLFLVRMTWLRGLLALDRIEKVEFHNGRLEEPEATGDLIRDVEATGRRVEFSDNFPRLCFYIL